MTKRKPKISYHDLLKSRDDAAEAAPSAPSAVPPVVVPLIVTRSTTPIALAAVLNAPTRSTPPAIPPVVAARATPLARPAVAPPRVVPRPTPALAAAIAAPATRAPLRTTRRMARATVAGRIVLDSAIRHDLAATGHADLLRFRIGPERFALRLGDVDEALEAPVVHPVPDLPRHVLGVVALRGRLVPVHAPAHVLGVTLGSVGVALVLTGEPPLAIAVDDVEDVFSIEAGDLRDAPGVDDPDGVLLGVSRHGGRLVGVLDAPALAAACRAPVLPESR